MRGNPVCAENAGARKRSIPACAGETACQIGSVPVSEGLSPRVRGNLLRDEQQAFQRRSIPACAGEPVAGTAVSMMMAVYPRVCGGTRSVDHEPDLYGGLSPRVRGNHRRRGIDRRAIGSIPACAGEP